MRLCSFREKIDSADVLLGALTPDLKSVVALQPAAETLRGAFNPDFASMLDFLDAGEGTRQAASELLSEISCTPTPEVTFRIEDVHLLAPLPQPRSIRDCMAFEQHIVQATRAVISDRFPLLAGLDRVVRGISGRRLIRAPKVWYEQPVYYKSNVYSVVGPEAEIQWPLDTEFLDYELEFGVVIGKRGSNISVEKAGEFIAGYTIFNDFTARDVQLREMQGRLGPAKGKDFDRGNALGPYLVTPDEIADPYALPMVARINGEEWSRGTSADMHFTFPEIISYISRDETLYPGEFIGSGTVGNGCGLELGRKLKPGDVVELEVESLGVLRNKITRPRERSL